MDENERIIKLDNPSRIIKYNIMKNQKSIYATFKIENKWIGEYIPLNGEINEECLKKYLQNLITPSKLHEIVNKNNTNMPRKLRKGILKLLQQQKYEHPLIWALLLDFNLFITRIVELFEKTCNVLKCSMDELISKADYEPNDTQMDRVQSMFAEMMTVNALSNNNFCNIDLLKSNRKYKNVDIIANNNNYKFVIDVARANSDQNDNSYENVKNIVEFINKTFEQKKDQLAFSKNNYNADKMMISVIIPNMTSFSQLNNYDEFQLIVKDIHKKTNIYKECDLILFVGSEHGVSIV